MAQGSDSFGFLAYRSLLDYGVGYFSQRETRLGRALEIMRQGQPGPTLESAHSAMVIPLLGRITGTSERFDIAGEAGRCTSVTIGYDFFATMARTCLGLLAVLQGDIAAAGEHYATLHVYRNTMSPPGQTVIDRVLGLLGQTMGNPDKSVAHFEDSLGFCRKGGIQRG